MGRKIRSIITSTPGQVSLFIIICCMLVSTLSIKHNGGWDDTSTTSAIIGGATLLSILGWSAYKLITKSEIKKMPLIPHIIIWSISVILFIYWNYIAVGLLDCIIWGIITIWYGIRQFKPSEQ